MIGLCQRCGLAILALGSIACGYFQAGSWEDDPKNWNRAFGERVPPEVTLTHSLYTRYPHFTHEHSFYLEFHANREYLDEMIAHFNLIRHNGEEAIREPPQAPEWFLPRSSEVYELWIGIGTLRDAALYIDKDSGVAYFRHFQL